jgi:hypothetical protein
VAILTATIQASPGSRSAGANPKNLALTLAAAASIAEAGLDQADKANAVAVFVAPGGWPRRPVT